MVGSPSLQACNGRVGRALAQNGFYQGASQWAIHPEMPNAMKGCYHLYQSHRGLSIFQNALRNIRVSPEEMRATMANCSVVIDAQGNNPAPDNARFVERLKSIVGPRHVLTKPDRTLRYRERVRFGVGPV